VQNIARISPPLHQALTISMAYIRGICTAKFSGLHRKTALTFLRPKINFTFVDGRKGLAKLKSCQSEVSWVIGSKR